MPKNNKNNRAAVLRQKLAAAEMAEAQLRVKLRFNPQDPDIIRSWSEAVRTEDKAHSALEEYLRKEELRKQRQQAAAV